MSAKAWTEHDKIAAAAAVAKSLRLFQSPENLWEGESDLYLVIEKLARRFEGPAIASAKHHLEQCDELVRRALTHPSDAPAPGPHPIPRLGIELPLPTDAACDRYTPQIDAAYYLGLAMGVRLAHTLGLDDEREAARR